MRGACLRSGPIRKVGGGGGGGGGGAGGAVHFRSSKYATELTGHALVLSLDGSE